MLARFPVLLALKTSSLIAKLASWERSFGLSRQEVVMLWVVSPTIASQSPKRVEAFAREWRAAMQEIGDASLLEPAATRALLLKNYSISRCPPAKLRRRAKFIRQARPEITNQGGGRDPRPSILFFRLSSLLRAAFLPLKGKEASRVG